MCIRIEGMVTDKDEASCGNGGTARKAKESFGAQISGAPKRSEPQEKGKSYLERLSRKGISVQDDVPHQGEKGNKEMKKMKRMLAIAMAVVMVLSMSVVGSYADGTVNVVFTQNYTIVDNFTDPDVKDLTWLPTTGTVIKSATPVSLSGSTNHSAYVPSGQTDQMPNTFTVMDAILACADTNFPITTGWDYYPSSGAPGAYVNTVNGTDGEIWDYGDNGDGTYYVMGMDWVVVVVSADGSTVTLLDEYPSNVAATAGTTIYVDYGEYAFDNLQ